MSVGTIEEALEQILTTDSVIGPLIVNPVGDPVPYRIYYENMPAEMVLPSIVYERNNTTRTINADRADGLPFAAFEFEMYGERPVDAIALGRAVLDALENFKGTVGTVFINVIWSNDEDSDYSPVSKRNTAQHDFTVVYKE